MFCFSKSQFNCKHTIFVETTRDSFSPCQVSYLSDEVLSTLLVFLEIVHYLIDEFTKNDRLIISDNTRNVGRSSKSDR